MVPAGPQPMQPYGPPPGHYAAAAGTVFGVPLAPGERVIAFRKLDYTVAMVIFIILGVILLIAIIGIVFILVGALMPLYKDKAVIVTTRRVMVIKANRQPRWLELPNIRFVEAMRAYRGRGIAGAVVSVALTVAAEMNKPWDQSYWMNARGLVLVGHDGQRLRVDINNPAPIGMLVARILAAPGSQESYPTANYLP
jgi:hypothetical protein